MSQPIAFFDIDGTVFRSSLLIELVEALIKQNVFPVAAREAYQTEYQAWLNREGGYEDYIGAVIVSYMNHIKGVHYGELADIGRTVVEVSSKRVYRYTRDYLHELKDAGYYTVALSQSPKTILDEFCASYGFDKVYGRMYEIGPSDRFTGVVIDEHLIHNKANIVKRVCERHGFDLEDSVAVGDTEGDIPMLDLVGKPVCFNPNQILYNHAKLQNWPVVVERKDVIYKL